MVQLPGCCDGPPPRGGQAVSLSLALSDMSLAIKISALAAVTALMVSGGGVAILLLLIEGVYEDAFIPIVIAILASAAAFVSTWCITTLRVDTRQPVLGPLRGGVLAFAIFSLGVFIHAALRPGAAGILFSFVGQFVVAFFAMSWIAVIAGCAVGMFAECLAERFG